MQLFVADQALRDLDAIQWELLPKRGTVKAFDIFEPIPVGEARMD